MKRFITIATAVAALAIPSAALANASPKGGITTVGSGTTLTIYTPQTNKNISVTQYKASYNNPYGQNWSCAGVRQVSKSATTTDSFTCQVSDLSTLVGWAPVGTTTGLGWLSDYDGAYTTSDTFTVTPNLDGSSNPDGTATVTGVATY